LNLLAEVPEKCHVLVEPGAEPSLKPRPIVKQLESPDATPHRS
jgi:hypothetical protein